MVRYIRWVENGRRRRAPWRGSTGAPPQLGIQKQSGTNTIEVIRKAKGRLAQIRKTLPRGHPDRPHPDQSSFILRSIREVQIHLLLGAFTDLPRRALLHARLEDHADRLRRHPRVDRGHFTVMRLFGFTLNNITLLALHAVGGDRHRDAIVVLENIFRTWRRRVPPPVAAVEAPTRSGWRCPPPRCRWS